MSENQALTKIEPMPVATNVEAMITLAIERGATVETIERLMAVRREVRAEQAKEAFDRSLAAFQAECPTIRKTAKVMNKDGRSVRYQYAPLDAIIAQVKELLQKHGFSYNVNAQAMASSVKATCKFTHAYGHSESSEFEVPIDKDAYMNPAQQVASALTFAKRYAFCNAAGIMTGDADDDSQASFEDKRTPQKPPAPAQATEEQRLRWIAELKRLGEPALAYCYDQGWLLPESGPDDDRTPGEPIEMIQLKDVPATKNAAMAILKAIQARMDVPESDDGDLGPQKELIEEIVGDEPELEDGVETVTGKLEQVSTKEGRSAKGPWKRYGLRVGQEWYNSFDKILGELALKDKGHAVRIQFRRGEKGNDLISIERPAKSD